MKRLLLITFFLCGLTIGFGQNINDNKVSFGYIQLPLILIDDAYDNYEVRVSHAYKAANEDSLILFQARQDAAMQLFERNRVRYQQSRDSLQRIYLKQLSTWEKQVNAGAVTGNGQPLPKPNPPLFPEPPMYPNVKQPRLHTDYADATVQNSVKVDGFKQGSGEVILYVDILPMRNIRIIEKKKGTGASTKYQYTCEYVLPIDIKIETPTQGILVQKVVLNGKRTYKMKEQKSRYDHQLYMLDQGDQFFLDLERYARQQAMKEANDFVNDQVGYVTRKRNTEIYSVKKFKNYDYSDVTNAYSATVQALSLVKNDRDCSGAQDKLEEAMALWNEIMLESNTYDNKARINDKITAMIQCNIAEVQLWQTKFNEANTLLNLVINAGVMKAKLHAKKMKPFYEKREKRWNVNF